MHQHAGSPVWRRVCTALVVVLACAGLTAGCGKDEVKRQHLDATFGDNHNCLRRVHDQDLETTGSLRFAHVKKVKAQVNGTHQLLDVAAAALVNDGKGPVILVNVCLVPYTGRCILRFKRATVAPGLPKEHVARAQRHKSWEKARHYRVRPGGDQESAPVLVATIGLAKGMRTKHACVGGASALGVIYRTAGHKRYVETPIDWKIQLPSKAKPKGKPHQGKGSAKS